MAKSVRKRIDELVTKLGESPLPATSAIRGSLISIGGLVEALEEGGAIRDAEARVEILESENARLKVLLQTLQTEAENLRADRKKREEEKRRYEIPQIQFQILSLLPSEHGGDWMGIRDIARAINIPVYEAEIHADQLKQARFVISRYNTYDALVWHRTMDGNKLVLAKRLAGGKNTEEKTYQYPDLPEVEESILDALLIPGPVGLTAEDISSELADVSEAKADYLLRSMEKQDFLVCEEGTYGTPDRWYLADRAKAYLSERDRL